MTDLSKHLRETIANQEGYSADHPPADVVMDANESPYDLPEPVKEESLNRLRKIPYNRYPESSRRRVCELYGDYADVDPEWVVAGNGSDELITYIIMAMVEPGEKVLVPSPTFSMYNILAEYLHARVQQIPLGNDWELTEEFLDASREVKMTFLSYPNNPTGNCFSRDTIRNVIEHSSGPVVVDEAYYEFSRASLIDLLDGETPLIVMRTLSKGFGLAGIRTGFLIGPPSIVRGIHTVRLPYNLNQLSLTTAEVALEERDRILQRNEELLDQRDRVWKYLDREGFEPYPSDANFILFRPDQPGQLYEHLLRNNIRIRTFSEPELDHCLRLSVGTPEQNDRLLEVLNQYS